MTRLGRPALAGALVAAIALVGGLAAAQPASAGNKNNKPGAPAPKGKAPATTPAGPAGPAGPAAPGAPAPTPAAPVARTVNEAFLGPWKATLTASYSTCPEVKVGDARIVVWTLTGKADGASAAEKGGAKGDPRSYTGKPGADGATLELRGGHNARTAGMDLRLDGAAGAGLSGRHVLVRKGTCVIVSDVRAERPTDQPTDVGEADPDAGRWTLERALAGLPPAGRLYADIVTDVGPITCELFPDRAPGTVANFVGLARGLRAWKDPTSGRWVRYRAYYDGLAFHRVIPDFIIQGGDPLSRDWGNAGLGTGGPGYTIADETNNGLRFDRPGVLAMANKGPNTASGGSQFFIAEARLPQLDGSYTIFGQCGPVEVIKQAARVPASAQTARPDVPLLMKVTIRREAR